jgi:hypothetical protein
MCTRTAKAGAPVGLTGGQGLELLMKICIDLGRLTNRSLASSIVGCTLGQVSSDRSHVVVVATYISNMGWELGDLELFSYDGKR